MRQDEKCSQWSSIDDHFAGRIRPESEQSLRSHLPDCESCRAYYRRHQILAELDPRGLDARTRLGRGLGLVSAPPARKHPGWLWLTAGASAVAATVAVVILLVQPAPPEPSGMTARGADAQDVVAQTSLLVYRLRPQGRPELVGREINARDELAFAYRNRAGLKRLLVFGVDEQENIYWYHPAWTDAAHNPASVVIQPGQGIQELPAAVSHALKGKSLRIYGVFSNRAWSVREIEALVHKHPGRPEALPITDARQESLLLKVSH